MAERADPPLILASASPRRRELLARLGVRFSVVPADIDERPKPDESPVTYVRRMASSKAETVFAEVQDGAVRVLGCDTAVIVDDRILGKPADATDADRMLRLLSGRTHRVLSAVTLRDAAGHRSRLSETEVRFRRISPAERAAYWRTGEPADKAGGYAIQGLGSMFVAEIRGSYSGVVGLPLFETAALLRAAGTGLLADAGKGRNSD